MKPRDRVLAAVDHIQTDRPPITIYVTPEIHQALTDYFAPDSYTSKFEIDFRGVGPAERIPLKQPATQSGIEHYDIWGTGYKSVANDAGGIYLEAADLALARLLTMDQLRAYEWPDIDDVDFSGIHAQIEASKDFAICLGSAGIPDIINGVGRGRGMDQVLMDIITEDEVGIQIIDRRVDFYYEWIKRGLEAGGGKIDIVCLGEDLGSQKGPTMSPSTFDSFFRPRMQRFIDLAHNYGARAMLHSCGSTRMLQPRLIEMGLDILDAVQPEPEGMDPQQLKSLYGNKLTYCGMISTQHTLPHCDEDECRAEARHRIDVIAKDGGYIFAPAHAIQPDTPLRNVLAIYEEVTGSRFLR